jgi:hypothetical protein
MKSIKKVANSEEQNFDLELFDKKRHETHSADLGLDVPKDYFKKSKSEIIALTTDKKEVKLFTLRKSIIWMAAAGIALILAITVFKPETSPKTDIIISKVSDTVEKIQNIYFNNDNSLLTEDVLLTSLYVDESEIDNYVDNDFINEIIVDEYIDYYFVENTMNEELFFN